MLVLFLTLQIKIPQAARCGPVSLGTSPFGYGCEELGDAASCRGVDVATGTVVVMIVLTDSSGKHSVNVMTR